MTSRHTSFPFNTIEYHFIDRLTRIFDRNVFPATCKINSINPKRIIVTDNASRDKFVLHKQNTCYVVVYQKRNPHTPEFIGTPYAADKIYKNIRCIYDLNQIVNEIETGILERNVTRKTPVVPFEVSWYFDEEVNLRKATWGIVDHVEKFGATNNMKVFFRNPNTDQVFFTVFDSPINYTPQPSDIFIFNQDKKFHCIKQKYVLNFFESYTPMANGSSIKDLTTWS